MPPLAGRGQTGCRWRDREASPAMRVLVVARTRMGGDRVCVGGLDMAAGTGVRLLRPDETNLLEEHPIRPGDVWEVSCTRRRSATPPHVEDVLVTGGRMVDSVVDLKRAIL